MRLLPVIIGCLSLLYPLIVYAGFRAGYYQAVALLVTICLAFRAQAVTRRCINSPILIRFSFACAAAVITGIIVLRTPQAPLFFPACINVALCALFTLSFLTPKNAIERIALRLEGTLPPEGRRYCTKVCIAWIIFFAINAAMAFDSAFRPLEWWALYNGMISYCCIGLIFGMELLIRRSIKKRLHRQIPAACLVVLFVNLLQPDTHIVALAEHRPHQPTAVILEPIRHRLTPPGPFSADFTESRFIAVLTKPLTSQGTLRCIPDRGLLWETISPVHRQSIITRHSIAELVGQQTVATTIDSTGMSHTMLSLLSGHIDDIDDHFDISVTGDTVDWRVQLSPKDSLVRQVINTVSVSGKKHPQQLEVVHASGDRVVTTFSEPQLLTAAELEQIQEVLKRVS
jgi:uncharacterized membrane protein